jgi:hypothetical protein
VSITIVRTPVARLTLTPEEGAAIVLTGQREALQLTAPAEVGPWGALDFHNRSNSGFGLFLGEL